MRLLFFILISLSCRAQVEITTYNGRKVAIVDWREFVQANVNHISLQFRCQADADSLYTAIELRDMVIRLHTEEIQQLRSSNDSLSTALRAEKATVLIREAGNRACRETIEAYKVDVKQAQKKVKQLRFTVGVLSVSILSYSIFRIVTLAMNN